MRKFWRAALAAMLAVVLVCSTGISAFAAEEETEAEEEAEDGEAVEDMEGYEDELPEMLELGEAFPDFSVELSDGSVFTLSEALETHDVVMVNCWGTWCGPCRSEMPAMNEAWDAYADQVAVVCLSDADDNESIAAFLEENELTLPAGYDSVGVSAMLVTEGYPTNVIVDRFGNYVYYECGAMTDPDSFARMFDLFLGEDYTESVVVESIPGPTRGIDAVSDEELTAAICPDGSLVFTTPSVEEDEHAWAFVPYSVMVEYLEAEVEDEEAEVEDEEAEAEDEEAEVEDEEAEVEDEEAEVEDEEAEVEDEEAEVEDEEAEVEDEEAEVEDEESIEDVLEDEDINFVVNSNCGVASSYAVMNTVFDAVEGDVFAFDYMISSEAMYDGLYVTINGETARFITGECDGTYAYIVPEDGTYEVELMYSTDDYATDDEDLVALWNAKLATGDEAAAIIEAMPVFPQTLEGEEMTLDVMNESAQEVVFEDTNGYIEDYFPGCKFYIVPEEYAQIRVCIGTEIDPYAAVSYGDWDGVMHTLSQIEYDEDGFIYEAELSSVEIGGYNNTYFYALPDAMASIDPQVVIFVSEENVNNFCYVDGYADAWTYADGTEPSTDEVAEAPEEFGFMEYTITIVDENGDPVDGCMVNVCTEETCTPGVAEGGIYTFVDAPYPYIIHVLTVPEGYEFDTDTEFVMDETGVLEIVVPHAE